MNLFSSFHPSSSRLQKILPFWPVLLLGGYAALLWWPPTRQVAAWLVQENRPVELLTFLALFAGGLWGLSHARHLRRQGVARGPWGFYACFSAGLLLVAMEEIAWGQQFLRFETPMAWKHLNVQDETTLHNLEGMQGHAGLLYLLFSLVGLWGLRWGIAPAARLYAVPRPLLPWLLTIAVFGALHLYLGYDPTSREFNLLMRWLSEVVELFVGLVAFRFIWHQRRLQRQAPGSSPLHGRAFVERGRRFNFAVPNLLLEATAPWKRPPPSVPRGAPP